jgi:hypothetical protein
LKSAIEKKYKIEKNLENLGQYNLSSAPLRNSSKLRKSMMKVLDRIGSVPLRKSKTGRKL